MEQNPITLTGDPSRRQDSFLIDRIQKEIHTVGNMRKLIRRKMFSLDQKAG